MVIGVDVVVILAVRLVLLVTGFTKVRLTQVSGGLSYVLLPF